MIERCIRGPLTLVAPVAPVALVALVALLFLGSGCPDPGVVTVDLDGAFEAGAALRDAYSGATATVDDRGRVAFPRDDSGVLLIERDQERGAEAGFFWDNVTVYFVITDRFHNGDTSNDTAYGREPDGGDEVGTFHGGDLLGLTEKLDHLDDLGVSAIWITAPYEQILGWVGGGSNPGFKHYPYHGYFARDYTVLDQSMGTEAELRAFVDAAHERGMRVIFDVVMNHPGYASMAELADWGPEALGDGWDSWEPDGTIYAYHELFIDYDMNSADAQTAWSRWWGPDWIRAELPGGYPRPGGAGDDLTRSLSSLPDFRTENPAEVGLPQFLVDKAGRGESNAAPIAGATVRDYLVTWLSDWVREYGVDGFRCDTAKHVELDSWVALKQAGTAALAEWKAANPSKSPGDEPFWMTGEVFPHGIRLDEYYTSGAFDSLINFDFQGEMSDVLAEPGVMQTAYARYAGALNPEPGFNVLSYVSSHDTSLVAERVGGDLDALRTVATVMLMLPGGVQIFYGDETGRRAGPDGGDPHQGTRSDMNWGENPELLAHWQTLGRFRRDHVAVGAGAHRRLELRDGLGFVREYDADGVQDTVAVVLYE